MQQQFSRFFEGDRDCVRHEEAQEARRQVLERFLVVRVVGGPRGKGELLDGLDGFLESPPKIIVFGDFADDLETLKDVDDIVDAPAFDPKLESDLVEFQQHFSVLFEVLDEFAAEFLQALLLAVVGQDLAFDHFLLQLRFPC